MISLDSKLRPLRAGIFLLCGRRPYAPGYLSYRRIQLQQYLSEGLPDGTLPKGWGLWLDERAVEYPWFLSRLPRRPGKLLDAGSVLNYDYILCHEALANKTICISTLAPESTTYCDRGVSYVYEDLRDSCYRDNYFDWIVSISTLEHIGMNNTLFYTNDSSKNEADSKSHLQAVLELHRTLKAGGVLYLTLPFGRAQGLGWLQIFDSDMVQRILEVFDPAFVQETYFQYTNIGWQISSADQCRNARYFNVWDRDVIRTDFAAAEAVVCLELVK